MHYSVSSITYSTWDSKIIVFDTQSERKFIYLRVIELNNKIRAMHGFRQCRDEIEDLFRGRYP